MIFEGIDEAVFVAILFRGIVLLLIVPDFCSLLEDLNLRFRDRRSICKFNDMKGLFTFLFIRAEFSSSDAVGRRDFVARLSSSEVSEDTSMGPEKVDEEDVEVSVFRDSFEDSLTLGGGI